MAGVLKLGVLVIGDAVWMLLAFDAFRSGADLSCTYLVCLSEVGRLLITLVALARDRTQLSQLRLKQSSQDDVLLYLGFMVPAALRQFNNLLVLGALNYGTPAVLQAFLVSKLPFIAILQYFLVKHQRSIHAWLALSTIVIGLIVVSRSNSDLMPTIATSYDSKPRVSTDTLAPVLLGLIIGISSAFANVITEQMPPPDLPFWVAQFYLSTFGSLLVILGALMWDGRIGSPASTPALASESISTSLSGIGYYSTIAPITALLGLLVAHSDAGQHQYNVVNLIGDSASTVLIFLAQVVLYPELRRFTLTPNMIVGTGVVAGGAWTYEQASRGSTRRGAEMFSLWSPFFFILVALIVTSMLVVPEDAMSTKVEIDKWVDDLAARVHIRQRAVSREERSFSTTAGGEVKLHQLSWEENAEGDRSSTGMRSLSTYGSMCVEVRPTASAPSRYWLAGEEDVEDLGLVDVGANATWTSAFRFLETRHSIGLKKSSTYDGQIRWINGTTLGYTKFEEGNHPAAVMRSWAAMVSLATNGAEILASYGISATHFFDHYYLVGTAFEPSDWTNFIISSSLEASRKSLPGATYGSVFYPAGESIAPTLHFDHNIVAPLWHDESETTGSETAGLVCFESMVLIHEDQHYFRDAVDAEYYRRVALRSLSYLPRAPACEPQMLNAVILLRSSRPLHNEDQIGNVFTKAGLNVKRFDIETIVANGTFEEQVAIFQGADILISVHGSHLNNQIFMEPTSTLIEVFPRLFYHNEQKRLAEMTDVNHVEITDNEYPGRAAFEKYYRSKEAEFAQIELAQIDACLLLGQRFLSTARCFNDRDCRICHRSLGALANIDQVERALVNALLRFSSSPTCAR